MTTEPTAYQVPTGDGPMPGLLWRGDEAPGRPGIVVLQEIFGLSDYVRERCADLAQLGYVVLAPQIYWRIGGASTTVADDEPDSLERALGLMQRAEWDCAVADGAEAVRELRRVVGDAQVGLVGFCYGGGLAYKVAASLEDHEAADALVSYYGSALPQLVEAQVRVEVASLHHFGTADDYIPTEQVERIRSWVTDSGSRDDVEVQLHEGAGHAFDNPNPVFHHAQASAVAWVQTKDWLAAHLPVC